MRNVTPEEQTAARAIHAQQSNPFGKPAVRVSTLRKGASMNSVFEYGGKNFFDGAQTESLIHVHQQKGGKRLFTVTYGLQRKADLTYDEACKELGAVILHYQCCQGIASNEGA